MVCLSESRRGVNFRDVICARRYYKLKILAKIVNLLHLRSLVSLKRPQFHEVSATAYW